MGIKRAAACAARKGSNLIGPSQESKALEVALAAVYANAGRALVGRPGVMHRSGTSQAALIQQRIHH